MKKFLLLSLLLACNLLHSQPHKEKENQFGQYLNDSKIPSRYKTYLKVKKDDPAYLEALLFRNQYGWVLYETDQLYEDIPALLTFPEHRPACNYLGVFRIQSYPSSEWPMYSIIAEDLLLRFDSSSTAYREVLAIKVFLDVLMRNDDKAAAGFPSLLHCIDSTEQAYGSMMQWYGISLVRNDQPAEALSVYSKGYRQTHEDILLMNYAGTAWRNNWPDSILLYTKQITADTSGSLWFYLGDAYRVSGDSANADLFYRKAIDRFEHTEGNATFIKSGLRIYSFDSDRLEIVGDFYSQSDPELSCYLYSLVPEAALSELKSNEFSIKKMEEEVASELRRKELIAKLHDQSDKTRATGKRVELKLKKCAP